MTPKPKPRPSPLVVRAPPALTPRIDAQAQRRHQSRSAWILTAIDEKLERDEKINPSRPRGEERE